MEGEMRVEEGSGHNLVDLKYRRWEVIKELQERQSCAEFLKVHSSHLVEDLGLELRAGEKARVEIDKFKIARLTCG